MKNQKEKTDRTSNRKPHANKKERNNKQMKKELQTNKKKKCRWKDTSNK